MPPSFHQPSFCLPPLPFHAPTPSLASVCTCVLLYVKLVQGGGVKHALNPDPYRGRFGNDGPAYAEDVRDLIQTATSGQVAGFLSETIQGVGGATPLADGYLAETYKVNCDYISKHWA